MVGRKIRCLITLVVLGFFILAAEGARSKAKRQRGNKSRRDQTTVVSCRVFRRGVCPLADKIKGLAGITSHGKCQEACYAMKGCSAFTYYRKAKRISCNLFSNCNGKLGKCTDCVSGPVMPRVGECLAERITAPPPPPKKDCSCHNCCAAICLGPQCPAGTVGIFPATTSSVNQNFQTTKSAKQTLAEDYDTPNDDYNSVEDGGLDDVESVYDDDYTETDYYDDDVSTAASAPTTTEDDIYDVETTDDYYDTEYLQDEAPTLPPVDGSDVLSVDLPEEDYDVSLGLEEEGIEEVEDEAEEVDMNIDSGLLSDSAGTIVDLPAVKVAVAPVTQPTYIFYFCAVGGFNTAGSVAAIDMLNLGQTAGLLGQAQALVIPPLPAPVTRGTGEVMASYTGRSLLTCSPGYTVLTPYGFQYVPGTCFDYNLAGALTNQVAGGGNNWQNRGGKMQAYRQGASIIRLGRYMLAIGGHREKRRLRSIEAFDPKRPRKGWRRVPRMSMPTSATEHCAVTVKGDRGKEILIIGGKGRENRVLKYGVKANRWYSLNRLTEGRRKHACAKVMMNGRPGVIVSGGRNRQSANLTSVEFYDSKTGVWFKMPSLNVGREGHQMTLKDGKLTVIGGETRGRRGRKLYLDNSEVFTGKRWVKSKFKLDKPRSGFSMVKIPRKVARGGPRSRNG